MTAILLKMPKSRGSNSWVWGCDIVFKGDVEGEVLKRGQWALGGPGSFVPRIATSKGHL